MVTLAERALEALGKVPIPITKVEGGYTLGPGYRELMNAYDAAQEAVNAERA